MPLPDRRPKPRELLTAEQTVAIGQQIEATRAALAGCPDPRTSFGQHRFPLHVDYFAHPVPADDRCKWCGVLRVTLPAPVGDAPQSGAEE